MQFSPARRNRLSALHPEDGHAPNFGTQPHGRVGRDQGDGTSRELAQFATCIENFDLARREAAADRYDACRARGIDTSLSIGQAGKQQHYPAATTSLASTPSSSAVHSVS